MTTCPSRLVIVWFSSFALTCSLCVDYGFPLQQSAWWCFAGSILVTLLYSACAARSSGVRPPGASFLVAIAVLCVVLMPYLKLGLSGSLGTSHPDGWNHTVRGLYLWQYAWGETEGLPVVYQYATHLSGTRWGASSLLAGLTIFAVPGDPTSALTLFFVITTGATLAAYWMLGSEIFPDLRLGLLFVVFASVVSWTPQILGVGNYENSLFNAYPPVICAVILSLRRRPASIPDAILAAVCSAAAFAGYPEGTAVFAVLLAPFLAVFLPKNLRPGILTRFLLPFSLVFAALAAPSLPRFLGLVLRQLGHATADPVGAALRPGETLFPGLLSAHAPSAFFAVGATEASSSWALLLAAYVFVPVTAILGVRSLANLSRCWIAASLTLAVLSFAFVLVLHYDYGVYKVANIGAFIWAPVLFAGLARLAGVDPLASHTSVPMPRLAILASMVIAACVAKTIHDPPITLVPASRYSVLAADPRLSGTDRVELRVASATDQLWATYFLRSIPLTCRQWRSYLGQPHVAEILTRAERPDAGRRLFLHDSKLKGLKGNPRLLLSDTAPPLLYRIENPNGVERLPDGRDFVWLGQAPIRFYIDSTSSATAQLLWDRMVFGPNSPGESTLDLEVTDAMGTRQLTLRVSDEVVPVRLSAGEQQVIVRCLTAPREVCHANQDARVLMIGLTAPRIESLSNN
jgi:hypothetical protein